MSSAIKPANAIIRVLLVLLVLPAASAPASCPAATECRGQWCTDGLPPLDPNSDVRAMAVCHGRFYIGGFLNVGGVDLNGVARLGTNAQGDIEWQPLARGVFTSGSSGGSGVVHALECFQNKLYVGGSFYRARNATTEIPVGNIARWTGTNWEALASGPSPGVHGGPLQTGTIVYAMTEHNGLLIVGGIFSTCRGGYSNPEGDENPLTCVNSIASYDGAHWHRLGFGLERAHTWSPAEIRSLLSGPDGSLYVGGVFESAAVTHCLDENELGPGDDEEFGCPVGNPSECVCQGFCAEPLYGLARWNGTSWHSVGGGVHGYFPGICAASNGCDLHHGGAVLALGIREATNTTDLELIVGGRFVRVGLAENDDGDIVGISAQNIAAVNLSTGQWNDLSGGFTRESTVTSLAVFDDRTGGGPSIYVGTDSTLEWRGNPSGSHIAKWGRSGWTWIDDGAPANVVGAILAMRVLTFPGEGQPSLHVGGSFSAVEDHLGTRSADKVARWLVPRDSDDDLVPNACDNCPAHSNPNQADDDRDGLGNACDTCRNGNNAFDVDGDGLPNGCDNCADVANADQEDTDQDGIGDACALTPSGLRLVRTEDRAGRTLEVFEHQGSRLARRCRGTSCSAGDFDLLTTYEYHADGRLATMRHVPVDGTAGPRESAVVYDPDDPLRVIGSLATACGCGTNDVFTYYDSRGRARKVTTANPDPQEAITLEEIEYVESEDADHDGRIDDANGDGVIDDRVLTVRRRDALGAMVTTERRVHSGGPVGAYDVLICRRVDSSSDEVRKELYFAGQLLSVGEYAEPRPPGCADPGPPDFETLHTYARTSTPEGRVTGETFRTVFPSGFADVSSWSTTGVPGTEGSARVRQTYRENRNGVRVNLRVETHEFNALLGDYRLASIAEPGGAVTQYAYHPTKPDRVISELRSPPGGMSNLLGARKYFEYEADPLLDAGRVKRVLQPGPEAGDLLCHAFPPSSACRVTRFDHDVRGRLVRQVDDEGGLNRVTENRYNVFDELIVTREPGQLVRGRCLDESGRLSHEYAGEYAGELTAFGDACGPPAGVPVLEQRHYEYHPVSGRLTELRTVLSDTVPFVFVGQPAQFSSTVHAYDAAGAWLLWTAVDGLGPTRIDYDDRGRVRQSTSPEGIVTRALFDGRGLPRESTIQDDALNPQIGLTTWTSYNSDGQIAFVIQPNSVMEERVYDEFGRLERTRRCRSFSPELCPNDSPTTVLQYDGASQVVRTYQLDADGRALSDHSVEFDAYGRPFRERRRARFNLDPPLNDDVKDRVTLSVYNAAGLVGTSAIKFGPNMAVIEDFVDQVTKRRYNNLGELLDVRRLNRTEEGQREERTRLEVNGAGRTTEEIVCLSPACDPDATPPTGVRTKREYDALGRVTRTIDPEGHYVEQRYDSRGHLVRRTAFEDGVAPYTDGAPRRQERWSYDGPGRLVREVTVADAASAAAEPDPAIDRVVTIGYDDDGRETSVTRHNMNQAAALTTVTEYDEIGRFKSRVDALGNRESHEYWPDSLTGYSPTTIRIEDGLQSSHGAIEIHLEYDLLGRPLNREQRAAGQAPNPATDIADSFYYDGLDRVVRHERRISAGAVGATEYEYDLFGQKTVTREAVDTPLERTTESMFDRLGRVSEIQIIDTVVDPGESPQQQTTRFEYDLFSRRTRIIHPDSVDPIGDSIRSQYDWAGRMVQRVDQRGQAVSITYDKRGLPRARDFLGGRDALVYDGLGRLKSAVREKTGDHPTSSHTFAYDDLSNLVEETQCLLGAENCALQTKRFRHEFDQAGNRLSTNCQSHVDYPAPACLERWYDALDREFALFRDGFNVASVLHTNGGSGRHPEVRDVLTSGLQAVLSHHFAYDDHRRVAGVSNTISTLGPGTTIAAFDSVIDPGGNRRSTVKSGGSSFTGLVTYGYDALERLTSAQSSGGVFAGTESFSLDLLGNRRGDSGLTDNRTTPGVALAYSENNPANEYQCVGGGAPPACAGGELLQYDAAGNLTRNEAGFQFAYDHDSRLIEVTSPQGAVLASHVYDPLGRRVATLAADADGHSVTTRYYHDGQRVFAEHEQKNSNPSRLARYFVDGSLYVDDHLILHERSADGASGEDFYYLHGPLFSVVGLVDKFGRLVEAYDFDAFGGLSRRITSAPTGCRYLAIRVPPGNEPVAVKVTPDCPGASGRYVGSVVKHTSGFRAGSRFATLAAAGQPPIFAPPYDSDVNVPQWGRVVYVTGDDIDPDQRYLVTIETLAGKTIGPYQAGPTRRFGDVAAPWGVVDFSDISRAQAAFVAPSLLSPADYHTCDVTGGAYCGPTNQILNFADISTVVNAFQGYNYAANCPVPCPSGSGSIRPRNPYFFTGRRLDLDVRPPDPLTGGAAPARSLLTLYDHRARAYNALHGRFLQRDPLGHVDGMNLYEYARSNPQRFLDPSGEGVFTLVLLGDFSASDWQFIRNGGLKGVASAAGSGAVKGIGNSVAGAIDQAREIGYAATDLVLGPVDIASTLLTGNSIGGPYSQLSQAGSNPDSLARVIADAGSRNVLNGITLGTFGIAESGVRSARAGDVDRFSREVGGQGIVLLVVAGRATSATRVRPGQLVEDASHCPVRATVIGDGLTGEAQSLLRVAATEPGTRLSPVSAAGTPRGGTYILKDPVTGRVMRVGRSNDLLRRQGEYGRDPTLGSLEFEPVHRTDAYAQQRGLEQIMFDLHNPPFNAINPISPNNIRVELYLDAADQYLGRGAP